VKDLETLLKEGKYELVVDHYAHNPAETMKDFLFLGVALFYLGRFEEALDTFIEGLRKFPDSEDLLVNAAEILYSLGRIDESFEYSKRLLNLGLEDPYIFDIVADYYGKIGQKKLQKVFAEKAHNLFLDQNREKEAEEIRKKYGIIPRISKKKMLVIGPCANYGDSFVKFVEEGWEIYVLKTPITRKLDDSNYEAFIEMGAKIVPMDDFDEFMKFIAKDLDLIFRTGCFLGNDDAGRSTRFGDLWQLNFVYKASRMVKEKSYKARVVVAFNGDTFVHDPEWANWLSKRLEYVDYVLFDTNNLMKYFQKHVDLPWNVKMLVKRVEVPLKRELRVKLHKNYIRRVLTMGRRMVTYEPVPPLLIQTMDSPLALGGGGGYIKRLRDRDEFERKYGKIAFGLGYFHDFYLADESFEEVLNLSLEGYATTTKFHNWVPKIYQFTNIPGKVITYLQFGIIPVLPKNGNDFFDELFGNQMAIPVEKDCEFFDPFDIPDEKISEMRQNILNNADIFTFDPFFEFVENTVFGSE
jgi:tetratricopeptide (TPR) repeat protein